MIEKKLISLQVNKAERIICFLQKENEKHSCGYYIPKYIAIGVFDDGTHKAVGLCDLDEINSRDNIFEPVDGMKEEIKDLIDFYDVEDQIQLIIQDNPKEEWVRHIFYMYTEFIQSGIKITETALEVFKKHIK